MPTVVVMGGIGCGKSTVARLLEERGAIVVDADVIAREVVEPGSPGLGQLVAAFGPSILSHDTLDRAALAKLAFADPAATTTLNEILHPAIGAELLRQVGAARERGTVVVAAIPLYRPEHREALGVDLVVCVDCPPELALERLTESRGLSDADARARMASQPSRDERRAAADVVLDNSDGLDALASQVDVLWERLSR